MNTRLQWGKVEIEYDGKEKIEELNICSIVLKQVPNWEGVIYHFGKDNWNRGMGKIFLNWHVTSFSEDVLWITASMWIENKYGVEEKVKVYIKCTQPILRFDLVELYKNDKDI